MELDLTGAKEYITEKYRNAGDFDFVPDDDLSSMLELLIKLDDEYLKEIDDDFYDEEVVYERFLNALNKSFDKYKIYNMRFADDYMDYMEQYLASIDAIDWE